MLVHLVDVSGASGRDPIEDFDTILDELQRFSSAVAAKPQLVAANKMDAVDDPDRVKALERHVKKRKLPFLKISGASGEGVDALLEAAWKEIVKARAKPEAAEVRLKADTPGESSQSTDLLADERRKARLRRKA